MSLHTTPHIFAGPDWEVGEFALLIHINIKKENYEKLPDLSPISMGTLLSVSTMFYFFNTHYN